MIIIAYTKFIVDNEGPEHKIFFIVVNRIDSSAFAIIDRTVDSDWFIVYLYSCVIYDVS